MVKRFILVTALTLAVILPAAAQGFEEGQAAQNRGDFAAAYKIWRPLAERGDAAAQNGIGLLYDNGEGVPQDHDRALSWYRKSARQGHAAAQYNLGLMYANGLGVAQSYGKAQEWYRKAADQGHREAKVNLDVLYLMGHVSRKDGTEETDIRRAKKEISKLKADSLASSGPVEKPGAPVIARAMPAAQIRPQSPERGQAEAETRQARAEVRAIGKAAFRSGAVTEVAPSSTAVAAMVEKPKEPKAKPPAAGGDFRVQLSSVKTEQRAMKEVARLKQAHKTLLGPLEIEPVRADLGDRGVFYRLRAGPLADWNSAQSLCRELSSRNQSCIIVKK